MCGRFTLSTPAEVLARLFELDEESVDVLLPRYNIAPTQDVAVIRSVPDGTSRRLDLLRWGLIPSWAKEASVGSRMINARGETVAEKPSFRAAFRNRRCLVPADGFYEWAGEDGRKQPYLFRMRGREPFAMAGLWESWRDGDNGTVETCTIVTTEANDLVKSVHDRMPVIIPTSAYDEWLDPNLAEPLHLTRLLRPFEHESLEKIRVGTRVNSPATDDEACIAPID